MRPLLVGLFVLLASDPAQGDEVALLFPTAGGAAPLRLDVTVDGKAPDLPWAAFLNKLFDHFDRDTNGFLSPTETARVFALPLPGGIEVKPDFAKLDVDRDGRASRTEFQAFYRAAGFGPIIILVRPASPETLALGDAVFRHLDRDGDGTLSPAELQLAPALLRRLDENEDDALTATELLGPGKPGALTLCGLRSVRTGEVRPTDAVLQIALGDGKTLGGISTTFQLSKDGSRLTVPGGICAVATATTDPAAGFAAAKDFYLAQFHAAAGDKPVRKKVFEDDPSAQVLAGLFDAADRNGDGMLTRVELDAFLLLIEQGVRCRVVIAAVDRGRNLFDRFDTNGDGQLDLGELNRPSRELRDQLTDRASLDRDRVPASYQLSISRGPVGDSFGPVPFGAAKPKAVARPALKGPRWFLAMDRNADGFVSPVEFIGPPELFQKLDVNQDGRISADEATAAKH